MITYKKLLLPDAFRMRPLACVIGTLFMSNILLGQTAVAQETESQKTEDESVEIIEVSGIRSTIEGALLEKRASDIITDGISADDLGNFPDLNLGEALQRIPGVQIDRESSRRSASISVRGLPGTYALTTVQGQGIASAAAAGRSANPFGMFDSSIFSGAYVVKSFRSDIQSGGLSANVDLRIKSALKRKDGAIVVRAGSAYEESSENFVPELFVSGAKHFDDGKWGVYGTVSWEKLDFRRDQININGYDALDSAVQVDRSIASQENAVFLYPRELRQISEISDGDRLSLATGFEYNISDEMSFRVDAIYANRDLSAARTNFLIIEPRRSRAQITPIDGLTYVGDTNQVVEDPSKGEIFTLEPTYVLNNYNFDDPTVNIEDRSFPTEEKVYAIYPQFNYETDNFQGRVIGTFSEADNLRGQQQYRMSLRNTGNNSNIRDSNGVTGTFSTGLGNWDNFFFNYDVPDGGLAFNGTGVVSGNTISVNRLSADAPILQGNCSSPTVCERDANGRIVYNQVDPDGRQVVNTLTVSGGGRAAKRSLQSIGADGEYFLEDVGPLTAIKAGALFMKEKGEAARADNSAVGLDFSNFPIDTLGRIIVQSDSITEGNGFFGGSVSGVELDEYYSIDIPELLNAIGSVDQSLNTGNDPLVTDNPFFSGLIPLVQRGPNAISRVRTNNFTSERDSVEAYVMAKFSGEEYDIPVRGNIGLRYVDVSIRGRLTNPSFADTPDSEGAYDAILPSLNVIYDISEDWVANFAYYETFETVDLTEFSPGPTTLVNNIGIENPDDSDDLPNVGNVGVTFTSVDLEPRTSTAYDLGLAWYNRKGSIIGLNYFHKEVEGDIDREVICPTEGVSGIGEVTAEDDSISLSSFSTGALFLDGDTCRIDEGFTGELVRQNRRIKIERNANVGSVIEVDGIEFQMTQNLDFLDGFWANFGFTFNYTYIDFENSTGEVLERVSPETYNLIAYYEEEDYGIRLAYNYRDEYEVEGVTTALAGGRTVGARGQLDLQANYQFGSGWQAKLQLFNLTDENPYEYEFVEALPRRIQYDGRTAKVSIQKRF